jgi:hypothetical protein
MTIPPPIKTSDMRVIDEFFEMGSGYVLDFSDRTFAEFFETEFGIAIDDPRFRTEGTSKAKRLRFFLKISDVNTRRMVLNTLWDYRTAYRRRIGAGDEIPNAENEFSALLHRISGEPIPQSVGVAPPAQTANTTSFDLLKQRLLEVTTFDAQRRGYAFEDFLKKLFDANGLAARASFRVMGEQIDGSFELAGETYLIEAKWTSQLVGAADLRSFNAKVEDKAAWARGLFVSYSGFTPDGLEAFGRGKRVVCMDGLDINDLLERRLALPAVLAAKVRRAAESGIPFVRVRDLPL